MGSLRSQPERRHFILQLVADPHLWIIALSPLFILVASSNWIFSPVQYIDPWVYHGFFRNLQEYKTVLFPGTYYGSRLSWVLPGYIFYKTLPPLAANYGLHLTFLYAAIFALYFTLRISVSRQAGLITSVFLCSYTLFLWPAGSDYVDGPANSYFFVCLAFLTAAGRNKLKSALFLAGVSYAAMVYANLFTVLFAPVIALYFVILSQRSGDGLTIRRAFSSLAWFLSGLAALTALLACANFAIEGTFLFYLPSIYYAVGSVGQPNPWKSPLAEWIGRAEWLLLPLVVAIAGVAALSRRWFRCFVAGPAAVCSFLVACLLMILCEWKGIPVLQYSYYASYLVPLACLVIGSLLERPLHRLTGASVIALAFVVLAVNSIPLWGSNTYLNQLKAGTWPAVPLLFGIIFAVCGVLNVRAASWAIVGALAACHVATVSTGYNVAERHAASNSFVRVAQAAATVDAVRRGEPVRFWYSKTDPHFFEFNALNAVYLWGYTMIGNEFPAILSKAAVSPGSLVVILSSGGDVLAAANESLRSESFNAELIGRREVAAGNVSYSLWFVRIGFDFSSLSPQSVQPCEAAECNTLVTASEPTGSPLPLDGWVKSVYPDSQASVERYSGGLLVTTVPIRLGSAAKYGPLVARDGGHFIFRLHYGLLSGGITFGAMSGDESRWLAQSATPQHDARTAVLSVVAEAGEPFWLVTSNNHPGGDYSSVYVIRELEAYLVPVRETEMATHSATP